MNFRLGCAVWAFRGWLGNFYPSGSRTGDFLKLYGDRLTVVEGNTTFYSTPDEHTVQSWASAVPVGFHFCPKLPRAVTHQGTLTPFLPQALDFLGRMQGLGDRLGPLFAQLPPRYSPEQWDDLTEFLQAWPRGRSLALEVRHPSWFEADRANQLNEWLRELGMSRVLLDTRPIYDGPDDPQIHSERRKPQVPLQPIVTAPFVLVRFISHPQPERNAPYLAEWVERIEEWLRQGTQVYLFVHCPDERRSPYIARQFQHLLEKRGVPVPPLPWDALEEPPSQLSLF
jgi:uncharacterized protein YecE (DUF72 family)